MKYLDMISDKIDYLFRRGKNADERCYDFFIRTITFLLVALIVLCYGSFVHAEVINNRIGTLNDLMEYPLYNAEAQVYYDENKYDNTIGGTITHLNATVPHGNINDLLPYLENDALNTSDVPASYNTYSILLWGSDANSYDYTPCRVVTVYADDIPIILSSSSNNQISIYSSTENDIYVYSILYPIPYYTSKRGATNNHGMSVNISTEGYAYIAYTDCSYYDFTLSNYYVSENTYKYQNNSAMIEGIKSGDDNIIQLNYWFNDIHDIQPDTEPTENNSNHLYLNDIQVGLTSQSVGEDILSSEVVIGVDCDDWILNNIDDYSLRIGYSIHFKDTMPSTPNDPTATYSHILPLKTFLNSNYSMGVAELLRNMDLLNYYNNLHNGGISITSRAIYNAILPNPLRAIEKSVGQFLINITDSNITTEYPYNIFDATLTVNCVLVDHTSDQQSSPYIKEFDFVNGISSIKSAEILRNNNPWEGEPSEQQSPIIPSTNYPSGYGYGGGGSTSVNVNVSGQKVPIGVKTRAEIETILNNYKSVNDNFMDQWEDLSDPNNNNNFIKFLNQETRELPAVNYLISGACCIFGLSILLFILKVLLF